MTDTQIKMLDELLEVDSGLSGKAIDFITDLDEHRREMSLSQKQVDWLEDLHDDHCTRGR